jgi:PAS domain S-box-containing protein
MRDSGYIKRLFASPLIGRSDLRTRITSAILLVSMAIIFLADMITPAGFAHGVLYVAVVLFSMLAGSRRLVVAVTVVATLLVLAGLPLSAPAPAGFPALYVYGNRLVSVALIITTGVMVLAVLRHLSGRQRAEHGWSRAETALAESDRMLQMASDIAGVGGWSTRLDQGWVDWTDEVARIHGREPGFRPALDDGISYYAPEYRDLIRQRYERCIGDGTPFDEEVQIIDTAGRRVWVRTMGHALRDDQGRIIGAHGAFMNIDRSKRLAQRLTTTLQSITDGFFLLDPDWRFTFLNQRAEQLLERSADDLLGKSVWEEFSPAVGSPFETHYRQAMSEGVSVAFEAHYGPLGRWFEVHAYPSHEGLAVYFQDITQRHESEARLRLLQAAVERINDVVLITDAESVDEPGPRIVYVNNAFERQTGYTAEEVIGRSPRLLQGPATQRSELDRIRQALESDHPVRAQLTNYRKNGEPFQVEIDVVPVIGPEARTTHYVAVQRDITERLAMEEQLRQSQRLEAIGQLTGGIAHDFNNLLTVILGNTELLIERFDESGLDSELARMIASAAQHGANLTQQLLAFARRQALEPSVVDVNALIEHMSALLSRSLGDDIEIDLALDSETCLALVDRSQLESALLNLALNARDAMPCGGRLEIQTAIRETDEAQARALEIDAARHVVLSVTDSGEGIEPDQVGRVFEPFYTTKETGKGTGLGLSMVYGFVKQSRGHVRIESTPGTGTCIEMLLPSADGPASEDARITAPAAMEGGNETILLVEDDDLVRAFAREQLDQLGYRVMEAENGPAALAILEGNDHIDLLFTDVVMPGGMSGKALAEAAVKMRPDLRVLYTSGYAEDSIVHQGRLDPDVTLLAKPYRRDQLAGHIRAVLSSPPVAHQTHRSEN